MNEKVPCAECGTEIRVRNHDRMKGLCVRCDASASNGNQIPSMTFTPA
jgi:hypothetical protein